MRRTLSHPSFAATMLVVLSIALLGGCQSQFTPIAEMSPTAQRVGQSLELWPEIDTGSPGLKRPFFTTVHIAGKRTTASGVLDYHDPRDFRITAITELGVVLFDVRVNWAGVTVLRHMPGLDPAIVSTLVKDFSRAFQLPESLTGLTEKGRQLVIKKELDNANFVWMFNPANGHLVQTDVELGTWDTLHIEYRRYNARGWPEEMSLIRKLRLYDMTITFTDSNVVQHGSHESAQ